MSDVNRYELSRDMKPEEWPPVLVDELDYELMKRTAFQAQEMAKEIAAENATLKARLAEATAHNNDIIRMSAETIRGLEARLAEAENVLLDVASVLRYETFRAGRDNTANKIAKFLASRADGAGEGGK